MRDTDGRQPKAARRDARRRARILTAHIATILDEPSRWIRLLPEEEEVRLLQLVQKLIVLLGQRARRRQDRGMRLLRLQRLLPRGAGKRKGLRPRNRDRQRNHLAQYCPARPEPSVRPSNSATELPELPFGWILHVHPAHFFGCARPAFGFGLWTAKRAETQSRSFDVLRSHGRAKQRLCRSGRQSRFPPGMTESSRNDRKKDKSTPFVSGPATSSMLLWDRYPIGLELL